MAENPSRSVGGNSVIQIMKMNALYDHLVDPGPEKCPLWVINCRTPQRKARSLYSRKLLRKSLPGVSALGHVWTAPGWQGFSHECSIGRCSHVFGL